MSARASATKCINFYTYQALDDCRYTERVSESVLPRHDFLIFCGRLDNFFLHFLVILDEERLQS